MDPIIVPEGKVYNLRYLYIAKSGANHKSAFYVDGYFVGSSQAPGEVNFGFMKVRPYPCLMAVGMAITDLIVTHFTS